MAEDQESIKSEDEKVQNVVLRVPFPETFVYSSASAFSLTAMDIKIGFAEAMPDRTVQPRVGVTLPIEHAVHVFFALYGQLRAFEDNFGQIRDPRWHNLKHDAGATAAPQPQKL